MSHELVAPLPARRADVRNPMAVASVLAMATALTAIIISWTVLNSVRDIQVDQAEKLLRSELVSRKNRVQSYIQSIARDLQNIASSKISNIILSEFETGFNEFGDIALESLQAAYITENPNPVGRKQTLLKAKDGSQYSAVHGQYHDWFWQLSESHDYYDLFLISASGDVVYSVYKEDDFASNLNTGRYHDTELAATFANLRDDPQPRSVVIRDFNPYLPSGNIPAAFMGSPIMLNGAFQGALIAQLKVEPFDRLLRQSRTPGSDHRTYLVGSDRLLRSTSLVNADGNMQRKRIESESITAALQFKSGVMRITDYRGVEVLSAYAPFAWNDLKWATLVELDVAKINQPLYELRRRLFILGLICVLLAFLAGWLLADHRPQATDKKPH